MTTQQVATCFWLFANKSLLSLSLSYFAALFFRAQVCGCWSSLARPYIRLRPFNLLASSLSFYFRPLKSHKKHLMNRSFQVVSWQERMRWGCKLFHHNCPTGASPFHLIRFQRNAGANIALLLVAIVKWVKFKANVRQAFCVKWMRFASEKTTPWLICSNLKRRTYFGGGNLAPLRDAKKNSITCRWRKTAIELNLVGQPKATATSEPPLKWRKRATQWQDKSWFACWEVFKLLTKEKKVQVQEREATVVLDSSWECFQLISTRASPIDQFDSVQSSPV